MQVHNRFSRSFVTWKIMDQACLVKLLRATTQNTYRITVFQYKLMFELKCKKILLITYVWFRTGVFTPSWPTSTGQVNKIDLSCFVKGASSCCMFCPRDHCGLFTALSPLFPPLSMRSIQTTWSIAKDLVGTPVLRNVMYSLLKL